MKKTYGVICVIFLMFGIVTVIAWHMGIFHDRPTDPLHISQDPKPLEPENLSRAQNPYGIPSMNPDDPGGAPDALVQISEIPKDLTHLKLVGTAVNAMRQPCAVIDNAKTHSQALYTAGAEIDGATLVQIHPDSVVLHFKGQQIKLNLEKIAGAEPPLKTDDLLAPPPDPFVHISQQELENTWEEIQELMTNIELEQHIENGEPKGVQVKQVMPDSVFEKIGFKPGDILVQVDDMAIHIADDALEVYNSIHTKSRVQFRVRRNGEPEPVILEYHRDMLN